MSNLIERYESREFPCPYCKNIRPIYRIAAIRSGYKKTDPSLWHSVVCEPCFKYISLVIGIWPIEKQPAEFKMERIASPAFIPAEFEERGVPYEQSNRELSSV